MQLLQSQQQWDLMREHHAELLKEAQKAHLVELAQASQQGWWSSLFRRQAQSPLLTLEASVAPEIG